MEICATHRLIPSILELLFGLLFGLVFGSLIRFELLLESI
jgi:hypothetical protein